MRLDAALMSADVEWPTTPAEKLAWRRANTAADSPDHRSDAPVPPHAVVANPVPGTFPIGLDSRGDLVVLYVATVPWTDDFRTFLIGHAPILGVASAWTVRLVFPPALRRAVTAYQTVTSEELEHPLSAEHLRELRHYFFHRRRGTDLSGLPEPLRGTLRRYADAFSSPRFTHLYRRWLVADDAVLAPGSTTIPEALASGRGHVEYVVLPNTYDHLLPLVDPRRSNRQRRRMNAQRGAQPAHGVNPLVNPVP
jgi:hypothetical protein